MDNKKKLLSGLFFILVMGLTFYTFLHGQSIPAIIQAVKGMQGIYFVTGVLLGIFFVSMEGFMIWYLMHSMGERVNVFRCIQYSFIGFFYSGITPSATGGQPMQLYYMNKDGKKTSNSTVTLMTVAVMYKLVLVLIGILLLLAWGSGLQQFLGNYFYLYLLGLFLNVVLVIFILAVMLCPALMQRMGFCVIRVLSKMGIMKNPEQMNQKWDGFVNLYGDAVNFLKQHTGILVQLMGLTFLQRISVFLVTYMVYRGFGLHQHSMLTVMALQASVYIAVDMLPIPGAQGITEMMYRSVFAQIFPRKFVIPSMLVSRGTNFYFPLMVSLVVVFWCFYKSKKAAGVTLSRITEVD